MHGLKVKDGRLVNERLPGETGIAQAARYCKMKKRSEKISMIADAINLADMREGDM
jgi:hypothetical protein